jgi:cysteinyl-tRNA synthetase
METVKLFLITLLLVFLVIGCSSRGLIQSAQSQGLHSWLYQLQDADVDEIIASGFKLVVMDYSKDGSDEERYPPEEIGRLRESGITSLAYLSIGEAEDYRFYWQKNWDADHDGLPDAGAPPWLGHSNPEWEGNYKVKYWDPDWQGIILAYLDKIIAQGFAGVYLDIIDAFEYWSDPENGEGLVLTEGEAARRMITFVERIAAHARAKVPGFLVFPQNGERILDYDSSGSYAATISGIGIEDLFYNETEPNPPEQVAARTAYLDRITSAGKAVLSVDYVDDGSGYRGQNKARIDDYLSQARAHSYIPYVALADRELNRINIIPGVQP